MTYEYYLQIKKKLQQRNLKKKYEVYEVDDDRILVHKNTVYVPNSYELRKLILKKMHTIPYS